MYDERMSLLDELHRRVDRLDPAQQENLMRWFDYMEHRQANGASDDLGAFAKAAAKHLAKAFPNDDWSEEYQRWKQSQKDDDAAG